MVIIWNNHQEASAAAKETAYQLFRENSAKVDERVSRLLSAVRATVDTASAVPSLANAPHYDGLSYPALKPLIRFLEARPHIYTVAAGFDSGAFVQVVLANSAAVRAAFDAPPDAHIIVRTISLDRYAERREYVRFLDPNFRVIDAITKPDPVYDPRQRVWFQSALKAEETVFSAPFVFATLQKPGITASRRLIGGGGVISVALTLSDLSEVLAAAPVSPNATAFIFNADRDILVQSGPIQDVATRSGAAGNDLALPKADQVNNAIVNAVVDHSTQSGSTRTGSLQFTVEGQEYLARVEPVGTQFGLSQFVAVAAPLRDFTQHIARMQRRNIATSLIALAVALPVIYLIARRISARLAALATEADRIRAFDLESPVDTRSIFFEVHNLAHAFASMKQAIRLFSDYVPKTLVRDIIDSGSGGELGGDRREITIMFTDIAGYTAIAEDTEPEDLMRRTSTYFEALGHVISSHQGVVDKYIGDAVMALWNAPHRDPQHVTNACRAALACRDASRDLVSQWRSRDVAPFETRIGLHCGDAVVGNVGGADRINFTAVGAVINLASRLEALNKVYGTEILVSQNVIEQAGDTFLSRLIDSVQPVGTNQPIDIHELIAAGSGNTDQRALCQLWGAAMTAYRNGEWLQANKAFQVIAERFPGDGPTGVYLARSLEYLNSPPGAEWDRVNRLTKK